MRSLIPCFAMIKRPTILDSSPTSLDPNDHNRPFHSATPIFRNFNSLFDFNTIDDQSIYSEPEPEPETDSEAESEPDLAAVFASQRFFFTSPGRSNSIIESSPSISTIREDTGSSSPLNKSPPSDHHSDNYKSLGVGGRDEPCSSVQNPSSVNDSVAVRTYSPDPYADFRRSMQEMVEVRGLHDAKANWEKLHELLLCYLALNPKRTHRFIVRAFADLLVTLLSSPSSPSAMASESG